MRSTTSSFHSSSHGDCDTADDRAVATSCTSPCWTIHASAWLLAGSSRCASSTRRITGPPRERARNESARDVDGPREAAQRADRDVTQQRLERTQRDARRAGGAGDAHDRRHRGRRRADPQVRQRGGHQVRLAHPGIADDEHAATGLQLGADLLGEGPDDERPSRRRRRRLSSAGAWRARGRRDVGVSRHSHSTQR